MRYIVKNLTHSGYTPLSRKAPPSTSVIANAKWNKFRKKSSVIDALLAEQYHLCCYSEINADEEFWGYHIEHIENKSQNPTRTFDPTNLGASALSDQDLKPPKFTKEKIFGGHADKKSQNVDMKLFVHCHLPDCHKFFAYLSTGYVVPSLGLSEEDRIRARYTIDHLNLNSDVLLLRRQQWHRELEEAYETSAIDKQAIQELLKFYITPVNHKLKRFFTMSQQFFASNSALL